MALQDRDKIGMFKSEIRLIKDKRIQEFTKACLLASPDYIFEDCPSSTSGKYHPVDELSWDGTIIHTKRVFKVTYELALGFDIESSRDVVLSSALLHDMAKQGVVSSGHTVYNHPQIMAEIAKDIYLSEFEGKMDRDIARRIYGCIFYHYGPWTSKDVKKPMSNYTFEELAVYTADFVASKRFIHITYDKMAF